MNPVVRPAEAAGLVLIRQAPKGSAEVLLGRRSRGARFMPGVYVFPGGRLSAADRRPSGFAETLAPPPTGLDARTRRGLAVFARAALRETFEETGLLLGASAAHSERPDPAGARAAEVWTAFARAGLAPAFGALKLVARAITPSGSPIRFHTRFFLADGAAAAGHLAGDGELEDIRWVPVAATAALPIAHVTLRVLEEALTHHGPGAESALGARPAALFHWIGPKMWPR